MLCLKSFIEILSKLKINSNCQDIYLSKLEIEGAIITIFLI